MDIEEIIKRYERGESMKALANELDVHISTISRNIKRYYEEKNEEDPIKKRREERIEKAKKDIAIIYERVKSGESREALADEYDISKASLDLWILSYCHIYNKSRIENRTQYKSKLTQQDINKIREMHQNKEMTLQELADKYGVVKSTITHYLSAGEQEKKDKKHKENKIKEISDKEMEDIPSRIIEMYENGSSFKEIKSKLGVPTPQSRNIIIAYMDIKNGKLSKKSVEILEKLGYDIGLIKKVAESRMIEFDQSAKQDVER